jgi:hypothetical protein
MTVRPYKSSLIAIAVSAALAACGGGGDDAPAAAAAAATPGATPGPSAPTTPGATPAPSAPTTTAPPVSGTGGDSIISNIPIAPGLPPIAEVPAANRIVNAVPASTYTTDALRAFNTMQANRGGMRGATDNGVGFLTQSQGAALDTAAQGFLTYLLGAGAAASDADRQLQAGTLAGSGFSTVLATTFDTLNAPVNVGDFCAKAIWANPMAMEIASAGLRDVGIVAPAAPGGPCAILLGISSDAIWQLPPTTSAAVYPYPAKEDTLRGYYGPLPAGVTGLASTAGHPIFVSVASNDALPVAVGGTAAVLPSQITITSFTLTVGQTPGGAAVDSVVLLPTGVVSTGVTGAQATSAFRFPTSMALVPTATLAPSTWYTVTLRGTVKGRTVAVNSTFRTGTN